MEKYKPDKAAVIPAIVGIVALKTPPAIRRALDEPERAITSKTYIMPVTVPSKPSNGSNATNVLIIPTLVSVF